MMTTINISDEIVNRKISSGISYAKLVQMGLESVERNERYFNMIELIDKQSKEIERLENFIKTNNKNIVDGV